MDPFSAIVGAVGLADAGSNVARSLYGKVKTYQNAREEIEAVAHDVESCTYLFGLLRSSVNASDANFTPEFRRLASDLVNRTDKAFKGIEKLIPADRSLDGSAGARFQWTWDKQKVLAHQQVLKECQQSYMVLQLMYTNHSPPMNPSAAAAHALPSTGSLQGTLQPVPVKINGVGSDGALVTYQATLTLRPMAAPAATQAQTPTIALPEPRVTPSRDDAEARKRLISLRQSPFFPTWLFGERRRRAEVTRYSLEVGARAKMDKKEDLSRKSSRSRREQNQDVDPWDYGDKEKEISDEQAACDIEDLAERLFGLDHDAEPLPVGDGLARYVADPPSVVERPSQSTQGKSPRLSAEVVSTRASAIEPPSPTISSIPAYHDALPIPEPNKSTNVKWACDGHNTKGHSVGVRTGGVRYTCRVCKDFDLCERCWANPEVTLKHPHSKRYFELRQDR